MDTRIDTTHHAILAMRDALNAHGLPNALAHVPIRVRKLIPPDTLRGLLDEARNTQPATTPTTDTVHDTLTAYCDNHPYCIVTTRVLADVAGCSQHTVRKFISNNEHYFKRFDQYKWEIRNYKQERQQDKENNQ
jgi:hypothetical protein